ncbi:MAG: SH3 domain-containing protein [Mariprofundaceae bacterium]|nr:SH3 domain-containing protein [Mariprofundaceae bacterium]
MSAVSAVSGTAVNGVLSMFQGKELSLPIGLDPTLYSVQKALRNLGLEVDTLVKEKNRYYVQFNNEKLHGNMQLDRETLKLTTLFVQVRAAVVRNESVEKAVLQAVEKATKKVSRRSTFSYRGYLYMYEKPDSKSKKVAWLRRGSMVKFDPVLSNKEWVQVKLPSNKKGFVKVKTARLKR